jgi:hypothetical protein
MFLNATHSTSAVMYHPMSKYPTLCDRPNYREVAAKVGRALLICRADVFRTADELLVHADRPTIDRVRSTCAAGPLDQSHRGGRL